MQRKAMTRLMALQFKILYKKGKENIAVDALSRVGHMMALQAVSSVQPTWIQEVLNSYTTDNQAQQLLQKLAILVQIRMDPAFTRGLFGTKARYGLAAIQHCKLKSLLPIILVHWGHSGIAITYARLKKHFTWKGMKVDVENFVNNALSANMPNIHSNTQWVSYNHYQSLLVFGKISQRTL
jgi:hypothetical protein